MEGPRDCYTEPGESDRERQLLHDIAYMWCLRNGAHKLIYKTEVESQI